MSSVLSAPQARLEPDFFRRAVTEVARALIGVRLTVNGVGGLIVETEAYDRTDPASHAYRGRTIANAAMFGPPGCAYVYRSYGVHWCLNFVCGLELGGAVLIRALEPTDGVEVMRARRANGNPRRLCAGPGCLCQALGVTRVQNGLPLDRPPFQLLSPAREYPIANGVRIGLTKAADTPWRFGLQGSPFLSRPF